MSIKNHWTDPLTKQLKRNAYFLLLPICLALGILRKVQLDNLDTARFGHTHSSGTWALVGYLSLGISLSVISMILRQVYGSRYNSNTKIKVSIAIAVVSAPIIYISLFLVLR